MTDIGKKIYNLRLERDLTMDMFVADMNAKFPQDKPLNKSMVSRWESGENDPSLQNARNLAVYFDVSIDYLIGLTDTRTPARLYEYAKRIKEGKK